MANEMIMEDLIYFALAVVLVVLMFTAIDAWSRWGRDRWRALVRRGHRRP